MKKLYFEGAGMFGCRDTAEELRGNCRLRTMFHDDKGRAGYCVKYSCRGCFICWLFCFCWLLRLSLFLA